MSVLTQVFRASFISTGTTGPYPFAFPISDPTAMTVTVNGTLLSPALYTVSPLNNNYDNGGSVTLSNAPPSGQTVVLQRSTPLTQTSVFSDNLPQPMEQFEAALDKLTEITQELAANQGGGSGVQTYVVAGTGILVTGTGTLTNPYVVSLATGFTITSFTGGQAGELGQSFVNPSFAATYSSSPTSASITNTDNINSPHALSTPFTSATLSGTFVHTSSGSTVFTLTASNGVTQSTATQLFTWAERIFAGLGAAGATSSVTAAGTTAVLSTSDILPSAGLGVEDVGQTFGPFSPSGQAIYLLLNGGAHTFTDAITGFPFAMNAPLTVTFTNQYGVVLTMYLYQSTNALTGTFEPKVAS
jgi:hypothetical protein